VVTEVLAIIPARGGSKSIPCKNIKPFCGFPLIAWSIAAAKQSKQVTRVIVSTDDKEIAVTARKFGAETPFLRPARLAQDDTRDLPVFVHALEWLNKHEGYKPDVVVQLRPTSPIRPRRLVDKAVETLLSLPKADSVRGVVPASQNPYKMWRVEGKRSPMRNLLDIDGIEEPYNEPRQALPAVYWQTGHIDAIRRSTIERGSMSGEKVYPLIIDECFAVDIDTVQDWELAERLVLGGGLDIVWVGRT
jgi:N-acylneuraminate cytidylyltransferase